jgi:hypothetical protein
MENFYIKQNDVKLVAIFEICIVVAVTSEARNQKTTLVFIAGIQHLIFGLFLTLFTYTGYSSINFKLFSFEIQHKEKPKVNQTNYYSIN